MKLLPALLWFMLGSISAAVAMALNLSRPPISDMVMLSGISGFLGYMAMRLEILHCKVNELRERGK